MRVLLCNKFFYRRGGAENAFFDTAELLEENGHETVFFSMQDERNLPTRFSRHFVSNVDLNDKGGLFKNFRSAGRVIYSLEARRKMQGLVISERPHIAHLHNFCHQLSPSFIPELKRLGVPVVMTLHDYKVACPVQTLLSNGKVCEACGHGRYYNAVARRCTKNSVLKSAVNSVEMYLHKTVLGTYGHIDAFISPSRFLISKVREMGFSAPEITYIPNFVDSSEYAPSYEPEERSVVFVGRLSEEKGLLTLIEAARGLEDITFKVIGDGPMREALALKVSREAIYNIKFLGYMSGNDLRHEIAKSLFAAVPSEWYENNPRSIIEAFALGKPVVGSRIGGIPELVRDGVNGATFEPGNAAELREKISALANDRLRIIDLGKNARAFVETEFDSKKHYEKLMAVYEGAMRKRKSG